MQRSGHSDLIPSWCKAPEDISPPLPTLPSQSELPLDAVDALEAISAESNCPKRGKKNKAKKKKKKEDPQQSRCADEVQGPVAAVVSEPGEKETSTPPQNSPRSPPLHVLLILMGLRKKKIQMVKSGFCHSLTIWMQWALRSFDFRRAGWISRKKNFLQ